MNTPEDNPNIKEIILDKILQVRGRIEELEELTRPVAPDAAIGRVSRMDAINNKSINEAALRQAREKLLGLQHALDRVDDPSYGKCSRCGGPIPMGRILIMPESTRCMRCSGF